MKEVSVEITKDKSDLKTNCPFCGSGATWLKPVNVGAPDYLSDKPSVWIVICSHCNAWGPQASSKNKAIAAWNTRGLAEEQRVAEVENARVQRDEFKRKFDALCEVVNDPDGRLVKLEIQRDELLAALERIRQYGASFFMGDFTQAQIAKDAIDKIKR